MNGIDFIADTNAVIYLLSGKPYMRPYSDARLGVSVITEKGFCKITELALRLLEPVAQ